VKCRACGTEIAAKAIVCFRCGAPTADPAALATRPAARPGRGWLPAILTGGLAGVATGGWLLVTPGGVGPAESVGIGVAAALGIGVAQRWLTRRR
jgi:hypothetical protein